MKWAFIDYEFNSTAEAELNLVSVAVLCREDGEVTFRRTFWLFKSPCVKKQAASFFRLLINKGYTFVAYTEAEARSFLALFGGVEKYKYLDLYLEYRCLLNQNNKLAYGRQYIHGKEIVTKPPPGWSNVETTADEDEAHHKPEYSLAAACYKLLGIKIDTVEKNTVRQIIIDNNAETIVASRDRILEYNFSDIANMPALLDAVLNEFVAKGFTLETWLHGAYSRGDYSARAARMVAAGYPVNVERLRKFAANVLPIMEEAAMSCMGGDIKPFRRNVKTNRLSVNEGVIRKWVDDSGFAESWMKTAKGKHSLSKDAFNRFFDPSSEGFGGDFYRYLKTKQSMNGFLPISEGSKRKSFFDFLGSDGRVRPFMGLYGAKTARSQPGAVGVIFLKSHWMRIFVEASAGRALTGADYGSQEFLVAAALSQDLNMFDAYKSGDVYMTLAIAVGLAPAGATRVTHKAAREKAKTLVLGMSYDMGPKSMAARLGVTEDAARGIIDTFYKMYPAYKRWKKAVQDRYRLNKRLILPDGWVMWGDNDNPRSVGNFLVQGHGSVIMRRAVRLSQDTGLSVIQTLHDALYIEHDSRAYSRVIPTFFEAMQQAFQDVMKPYGVTLPITLEADSWSRDYSGEEKLPGVGFTKEYVDAKGAPDLERYRKFFE